MVDVEIRKNTFLDNCKKKGLDINIDFSKMEYTNNRTPVLLIDNDLRPDGTIYGEFWITPSNFLKGRSHPDKRGLKISKSKSHKQDDIIKRFKLVHPNENLDYSEVVYVNMHTKVKIIDRDLMSDGLTEYGEYWQEPIVHLKGCGHPLKGRYKQIITQTSNTDEFINKSKKVHLDKRYDYSKVEYINNRTKVIIGCPKHGDFKISPDNFLQGKGCPRCGYHLSKNEDEIADIISNFYPVERNNRSILGGLELDMYIPSCKVAIEYNGLRWHSEQFKPDKNYHLNKLLKCQEKRIKLIQIFEDEYLNNKEIVLNKIFHLLNIDSYSNKKKIMGRKCIIREINKGTAKEFLNKNHIQGYVASKIYLGAFYNDLLVAVMSFTYKQNEWILDRFASEINYICQGIGGKLFKYFIKTYNPGFIKSFADRRWTIDEENNLYIKLGFKLDSYLKPEYRYYNDSLFGCNRMHKFGFRKNILNKKYGLPLSMTESEMTRELNCSRVYDCGLIKYVWKKFGC